jgi:hypothetical protein
MENLPTLTTPETQRLRADYPSIEHLEAGNVAPWLVERQEQLLVRAREERTGMNLAKLITLTGGAVGAVCYATSPLALIGAALAGVGYVWAVATDLNDSHQFAPIPFVRGNIVEFLSAMGDRDAREEWFANQNELVDLMFHLSPFERYEFAMLKENVHKLSDFLIEVEPGKRFYAYRWLLDWYINLKGNLPSKDSLTNHLTTVTPDPRVNYHQVGAIQQHQAQALIDVPNTPTVDLPETPTVSLPEAQSVDLPGAIGASTQLGAIDVEAKSVEVEQVKTEQPTPPVGDAPKANTQSPVGIPQSTSISKPASSGALTPPKRTLPAFNRDRIINESKGLMIIGDMGAAKTCVAQHIANGFDGHGIIVFDPHGMTDWGNAYVITKMAAIYEQMRILLDLLENGDTTPLLIICDEWLEIRGDRRNKKGSEYAGLADDFIRLFSTKPRKFNKLAAFVLHSPNVEAAGVDSFLRENYLKIYLGRLAKKEFSQIQDCAYPCILEDEQQEHPTHGHHTEFKPKGKAPRNLEPLQSAPITIPLAYMDGGEVKVCDRGWADGQLRLDVANIRNQLEMLYRDTSIDTGNDTDTGSKNSDTNPDTSDTSIDTGNSDTADTADNTGVSDDTSDTKTVAEKLPEIELVSLINSMVKAGLSQTQIICSLWSVEKNKAGWKAAYIRFKKLMGD